MSIRVHLLVPSRTVVVLLILLHDAAGDAGGGGGRLLQGVLALPLRQERRLPIQPGAEAVWKAGQETEKMNT